MSEYVWKESQIRTRGEMSLDLLKQTLNAVFEQQTPADIFLRKMFQKDRRIGGRDRRLYSELIFAVFRWYGPLQKNFGGSDRFPAYALAGAGIAENIQDPVILYFLQKCGIEKVLETVEITDPLSRLNHFLLAIGKEAVSAEELLPAWCYDHFSFTGSPEFYHTLQRRPPLWLRIQSGDHEKIICELKEQYPGAYEHDSLKRAVAIPGARVNLPEWDLYKNGNVEVQDLSSQCIGAVCAPQKGELWWDACAGGGGKSLQLMMLSGGKCRIIASDIRIDRLEELKKRAKRAGYHSISLLGWDGSVVPQKLCAACDGVLVDAPCSSSGRWRRNPESRWTLTSDKLALFPELQLKLLKNASQAVKAGGQLVYATCSMFKDEDEMVVRKFLESMPDFELEGFAHPLNGSLTDGYCCILPSEGDCDGSFVARFRRK
ncbi:MAG: RsmB/NOP family class I SAM-dependent RNA methyltransferase [Lentisphaeria bacterium]|nr:RsmB/NOP family class I SAM-dependent RNA methyltransferase [Lentisphaeria bacterium]